MDVLASRISYVGDLGWELYVPFEQGAKLWDAVWEAGRPHGVVPAGIGVYGTTGRLEKAYRAFGFELDQDYDVVEADMAWWKVKDEDFVGKEAHLAAREREPAAVLLHAHARRPHDASRSAASRSCARTARRSSTPGPPLVRRGRRAVARQVHPHVVPPAGEHGQLYVQYMDELYPSRRGGRLAAAVDPDNERIRS